MTREPFSIVIPVYNRRELIGRALQSVLDQTYRPIHLILVDNNSNDGTYDRLLSFREENNNAEMYIELIREKEKGASAARNAGLERVKGRFTYFFDSDDVMHPELAEEVMKAFTSSPEPDNTVVAWKARFHNKNESRILKSARNNPLRNHLLHGILATQRGAASTALYRRAGGWNVSLPCWNDLEYGTRILLNAPKFIFIDRVLVDIFFTGRSITGKAFSHRAGDWEESLNAIETTLRTSVMDKGYKLLPLVDYRRAILLGQYLRERKKGLTGRSSGKTDRAIANLKHILAKSTLLTPFQRTLLKPIIFWSRRINSGMATLFAPFF